jgi:uncharacterized protein
MSIHGSAMMYVTLRAYLGDQLVDQLWGALDERRLCDDLIKPSFVGVPQPRRVRVIREAEDRRFREGVGDLVRINPGDVRDHEIGRVDTVRRHEMMARQRRFELSAEEEIDPGQQDRRHAAFEGNTPAVEDGLLRGIEQMRRGEFFEAHESFEDVWRASDLTEKDFFQGLVHYTVAWYQAGRGNRTGCERQLDKAHRRLAAFAPEHRGVDVAAVLASVEDAAQRVAAGSLELPPPRI